MLRIAVALQQRISHTVFARHLNLDNRFARRVEVYYHWRRCEGQLHGSWVHKNEFFVLRSGRRVFFAATASVEKPANCPTSPINDRSSDTLVGSGSCDNAFTFSSSMVMPPCRMSYLTHEIRDWANRNFSLRKVIPAVRAA
jgi:hypothetical protein